MLDGLAVLDQLLQRLDADAQMRVGVLLRDLAVAAGRLDAAGRRGLIGDQQQRPGRNLVVEAGHEDGGGLHVDGHRPDFA